MNLAPGQTLLHYRISDKLGEGGMGVVWRAVDTTLDREVAIKVLPADMAVQPDRLSRFEREAKLLASLNHPNIAGIHGIHDVDGNLFLAMELVEGEDLAARLARGAMPLKQTLEVALQIAHAFEAAHESGVIHRDLKPANVKLTTGGTVKVLDFGLAKALADPTQPGNSASMSPTLTSAGTMAGALLGTAAYMSPEQAKAKEVDRRADIWSFGVVLFEMLCGRRLFEGEGISETLAAVIMKDVDWGALPSSTPPRVRRLLERCLERDPKLRLRDIGDARITLEEVLRNPEEQLASAPATRRRSPVATFAPWVVAIAALLALGWVWANGSGPAEPAPVMRFTLALAPDQPLDNTPLPSLAVSPDGERIVYVGNHANNEVLFLRLTREHEAIMLPGTEDADAPFFSPDGQWIGFGANGKLKKVSVLGGPPSTLCDAPQYRGGSWGDDGTIVFAPDREGGLSRVSEAGGEPVPLTTLGAEGDSTGANTHRWPQFLPGSHAVVFTFAGGTSATEGVAFVRPGDERPTTLVTDAQFGRFVPPGFLVFSRESTLFAARFDPERLELTGPAVPVLEGVAGDTNWESKHLAFSDRGLLVYLPGGSNQDTRSLVWVDREGEERPASSHERQFIRGDISPSGTHVAFAIEGGGEPADLWILELERDILTRLTFDEAVDTNPIWSPDGEWITFASERGGGVPNLYRKRADGTGEVERLTTSENGQWPQGWSPDGEVLAFGEFAGAQAGNIMFYRPGAEPEVETFLATPYWEWHLRFSPDGRWVTYTSTESGQGEIYLRPLDGSGGQTKISTDGGRDAHWAGPNELLYRSGEKVMSVLLSAQGGGLKPSLPREAFDIPMPRFDLRFIVSPDGQQILVPKSGDENASDRRDPVVVVNWADELEAKVPAAR